MNTYRGEESFGSRLFNVTNYTLLLLLGFVCLYPFYYLIIYSLSTPSEAAKGLVTVLPRAVTLENYRQVMLIPEVPRSFLVSVARSVVGASITLLCCAFFAYLVSKPEMYLRKLIYRFLIITMYVGGGLIPTYLVYREYGLRNNFLVYLLPSAISAYNVVLIKTYMESLPASLEESALLDGAGILTCWLRIILPLSMPILMAVGIFALVGQWNAWFDAHIYMTRRPDLHPLQYILYKYLNQAQALADRLQSNVGQEVDIMALTPESVRMTVTVVAVIPIMLVYPFLQKYFVKGIMMGAVKG